MLSIRFTGCSETKEFDAKGYVKSYLDAAYKNDYEAYAEFEGETTEELRDKWDEQTYGGGCLLSYGEIPGRRNRFCNKTS